MKILLAAALVVAAGHIAREPLVNRDVCLVTVPITITPTMELIGNDLGAYYKDTTTGRFVAYAYWSCDVFEANYPDEVFGPQP